MVKFDYARHPPCRGPPRHLGSSTVPLRVAPPVVEDNHRAANRGPSGGASVVSVECRYKLPEGRFGACVDERDRGEGPRGRESDRR